MHVTYLSLRDFRSYETVELSLGPGATAFVGPNGHGKTNLLEAVGYVATLRSHRVAHDGPLVRAGADRAVVRAGISSVVSTDRTADRTGRSTLVEIEINPGRTNRARLNRAPVTRPREVLGALRAVHFSPDDLALVQGDPAERRRFLDETLVARAPRHAAVRADYDRALKQRSALLKSAAAVRGKPGKPGPRGRGGEQGEDIGHTLDVWDAHLARAGAQLLAARLELLSELRPLVGRAYAALAGAGASTRMSYASTLGPDAGGEPGLSGQPETDLEALETALRSELLRNRPAEMERGVSLVGPHRDDLALALDGLPARGYASHGESWSLAFALRLAAYELLRDDGIEPVLLLDDVFAELDSLRRDRLAGLVAPAEQVLVTAAYADDVPGALADVRMEVSGGRVHGPGTGEGSAASG